MVKEVTVSDRTPEQWRDKLSSDLRRRQADLVRLERYYRGDHPLPWAPSEVRDAYLALMKMARTNLCRLVVDTATERLRVTGVRFSGGTRGIDVWERHWQGNNLDLESRAVHESALKTRRGFALVWPNDDPTLPPSITPESPSQVIVEYEPGNRRQRLAGLKEFTDDVARKKYCTLWTPEKVYNWSADWYGIRQISAPVWVSWDDVPSGIYSEADNPMGEVPLVEFLAKPALTGEPMGELDGGIVDVQDRINKGIIDRMVTSNFASFPQKWVTGLEIPKDKNGRDIEPFKAAVNRMFQAEDETVKFGEFSVADLSGYLSAHERDVKDMAAMARMPATYLLGELGRVESGTGLTATETSLSEKCKERIDSLTESWEIVLRLSLKADGDDRASDLALAMVWKSTEQRSEAEKADAATKLIACGVPWRNVMEFLGYTDSEIEDMDRNRAEDAATNMLATPPAQVAALASAQPKVPLTPVTA